MFSYEDKFNLNKPLTRSAVISGLKHTITIYKKEINLLTIISNKRIEDLELENRRLIDQVNTLKLEYSDLLEKIK